MDSLKAVAIKKFCHFQTKVYRGNEIKPERRLNSDSVPFNMDNQGDRTYIEKITAKEAGVVVSSCDASGDKRFGTIHLSSSPTETDVPCAVIFRGPCIFHWG